MDPAPVAAAHSDAATLSKLEATKSNLVALLAASSELNKNLVMVDNRLATGLETVVAASDAIGPLQTQSITTRALHSRINRALSPALSVLHSFSLVESLQRRLLTLSSETSPGPHLAWLLKYVDCVDQLNAAIGAVTAGCEPAVLRLQEAIEFLSRTKATDQLRIHRLRETLGAIKVLYEAEVDSMRYEGVLDEALLRLQDEYEAILQQIKHTKFGEGEGEDDDKVVVDGLPEKLQLGSDLEVGVLGRISETLASNDCLDICIDIYVKVRYRRAAKALMRLNPRYLKTYAPEEIDKMEWEALESAISLWIEHFQLAVKVVFLAEKQLCRQVLGSVMDGAIWPECFAKIADKIMAVFFRFGEGVARSSKEPQKLFKLLDMYHAMDRIHAEFAQVFDGESGVDICTRFRELQKLLVHAASKVFWEFGLQIEGLQDGAPPPPDGSVPKIVRYAVNYLKCLAGGAYAAAMGQVLRTEQMWKAGFLSRPVPDESLLREAISNTLDALQRNVEAKRSRYRDKVVPHVLAMNTYWYMYMRTKGSEMARLVGEDVMKKKYKNAAEEAAYSYQAEAWGPLIRLLRREEGEEEGRERSEAVARGKMEVFMREFDENVRMHQSSYCIADELRLQIKEVVAKAIVPAYAGFLHSYSGVVQGRPFFPPDSIWEMLGRLFGEGGGVEAGRKSVGESGKMNFRRREFRRRSSEERIEGKEEEKRGSFGRRAEDDEERMKSAPRREFKVKQVEEEEEEGRKTMMEDEKRIMRRREFRQQPEIKGVEVEQGGSFGRRAEDDEEERARSTQRREFKVKEVEEEEGRKAMMEDGKRMMRRREFRKQPEIKGVEEEKGGSSGRAEDDEERARSAQRREFKVKEVAAEEGRKTTTEDGNRMMRRREFRKQPGMKGVEAEGGDELKKAMVDGGRVVVRRREFKSRVNGGSGDGDFE